MASPQPNFSANDGTVDGAAAGWLAQRDRGFTAAEQDDYLEWLRRDPRHGEAVRRLDRAWTALDALARWRPEHSATPNPDLLAAPPPVPRRALRARRSWQFAGLGLAAAAAVAIGFGIVASRRGPSEAPTHGIAQSATRVIAAPAKLALPDGSTVQVNHGGRIEPGFTPEVRLVRLTEGEAHFVVARDAARPFVVEAGAVTVRAIGTEFDVRHSEGGVDVLVTEGRVQVESAAAPPVRVAAGHKLFLALDGTPADAPRAVTTAEVERLLSWQGEMLDFDDVPLGEVVGEFNQRNRPQLIIGDVPAGRIRIGGKFRADNVEAFVRLLRRDFGVAIEERPDGARVLRADAAASK